MNTLKVTATPNGGLRNALAKTLDSMEVLADKGKTKVVEMGGNLITMGLAKSEKFSGDGSCHMGQKQCNVDPEMDCRVSQAVYRAECNNCREDPEVYTESVYVGTTGCTVHKRTLEHMYSVQRHTQNPQSKHHHSAHPNKEPNFVTKIVKSGIKFNPERFII